MTKNNHWAEDELLEIAKTDTNAQYALALVAIKNKKLGYAVALLKAAQKQGHNEARAVLAATLKNLRQEQAF